MTKEELENYEPKGQLEGFPKEIIARMLDYQEEQGNKRDVTVFENLIRASADFYGFNWNKTKEGYVFWYEVTDKKNFDLFFEKYPKQDNQCNSQEFKVGDKVIDNIRGRIGKVTYIDTPNKDSFCIFVDFNNKETASFTLGGRYCSMDKYPRLLHYRDDYNYDVIDFNNLPKRQEPKKWRAKKGEYYYVITAPAFIVGAPAFRVGNTFDIYVDSDNENFEIGNYFQTREQAQEIADKLKEYFKQLINK